MVLRGRLGYVLFYNLSYYINNPLDIIKIWQGGMSFHDGLIGVCCAIILFCRKNNINPLILSDRLNLVIPFGLCLGRIANFINNELQGRLANPSLQWSVIFPKSDGLPRHPSTLYEAICEGPLLELLLLTSIFVFKAQKTTGTMTGLFLIGYGIARIFCEKFRNPDPQIGLILNTFTLGQILSIPIILLGIIILSVKNMPPEKTKLFSIT